MRYVSHFNFGQTNFTLCVEHSKNDTELQFDTIFIEIKTSGNRSTFDQSLDGIYNIIPIY